MIPEPLWLDILWNVPIVCVDVVVVDSGWTLIVKRKHPPAAGQWWVPGGRVLKGELLRDAALRIAKAELGIDCFVGPIVHVDETIFEDGPGDVPVHSVNTCFLLWPAQFSHLKPDDSIDEWTWISSLSDGWWQSSSLEPELHPYVEACLRGAGLQ